MVQAKQGVYAIINHDNILVGVKNKTKQNKKLPTRNPVCIQETPVKGVPSLPPPDKKILSTALI